MILPIILQNETSQSNANQPINISIWFLFSKVKKVKQIIFFHKSKRYDWSIHLTEGLNAARHKSEFRCQVNQDLSQITGLTECNSMSASRPTKICAFVFASKRVPFYFTNTRNPISLLCSILNVLTIFKPTIPAIMSLLIN